ncbi:LOW QUALITY PROTEIN: RING finger protein 32 [Porphyrio hochstetteri]
MTVAPASPHPPPATSGTEPGRGFPCWAQEVAVEWLRPQKGCVLEDKKIEVCVVVLQDHTIHSHQLLNLSLADLFKSRRRNIKNIYKPMDKEMIRAVVDTGLRTKNPLHKIKGEAKKKYVLDLSPPQLTLAPKSDLAELPSLPLTAKIRQRSMEHGDSRQPCAKSRGVQRLALQSQACLKAFEKCTGKRSCPVCREKQDQAGLIHNEKKLDRIHALQEIQAPWRGYIVGKRYKNLRKSVPPENSKVKKQFFEKCFICFFASTPLNQNS